MKKAKILFLYLIFFIFCTSGASAVQLELFDWAFNIDGTTYEYILGDSMPVSGTLTDGLGTLTWQTSQAGSHSFLAFFDHQMDADFNMHFNEYGSVIGSPDAGQSWEIDEPGFVFGNLYNNVLAGSLDNTNNISGFNEDVSMAMGWDFFLTPGQDAVIDLILSDIVPDSEFYFIHTDPDSNATIYLSSTLAVSSVPEPGTMLLLCTGLAGIFGIRKKLMMKN